MKNKILKELLIYTVVLLLMAYGMHGAELPERFDRILQNPTLFSHSLVYGFLGYLFLLIPRLFFKIIKNKILKK